MSGWPQSRLLSLQTLDLGDLPAPSPVKCGNRLDLPKKQRRHDYRYMGMDERTTEPGSKALMHIAVCITCGVERRSCGD